MKKMLSCLLMLCLLFSAFCVNATAIELDPQVADILAENPQYRLYEGHILDEENNIINELIANVDQVLDVDAYNNGEVADFFGIEFVEISPLFEEEWIDAIIEKIGYKFSYLITVPYGIDIKEAMNVLANNEHITAVSQNAYEELADEAPDENRVTLTSPIPDEEIAKKLGYTIKHYLKDGWEVPAHYLDSKNNIPNEILFVSNREIDISEYKDGELADFFGVEILNIICAQDIYPQFLEYNPNKYDYTITTANFYTPEEVEALFAEYDFISEVKLNAYLEPALEVEEVPCDVNFDNVFDTMDYITVKRAYFGTYDEAQMYCNKGDLNNNLEIDAVDSALMKRAYFDLFTVEE